MSKVDESFFVAIGCMDGRVQEAIASFGKKKFDAKFPDTITEAGLVGLFAKENIDLKLIGNVAFKVFAVSSLKHKAKGIVVHGHEECAGHPVEHGQHKKDTIKAAKAIKDLMPHHVDVPVIPVFVKRGKAGKWIVEEL